MILTIGQVARQCGVAPWQVRRAIQRGFLPEPARVGAYRIFAKADLPEIAKALQKAGYAAHPGPPGANDKSRKYLDRGTGATPKTSSPI